MKIGVYIPCYKLDNYLKYVVDYFKHWDTLLVISKSYNKYGQVNVRNEGLQKLFDCDYVWTVDGDEIIFKEEQERLLKEVVDNNKDAALITPIHYADKDHIYRPTDHKPVVLLDPKKVSFYETRCIKGGDWLWTDDYKLHHLGFTFPDKKMKWKKDNYWNTGNRQEVNQIMEREKITYDTPKEIKEILWREHLGQ